METSEDILNSKEMDALINKCGSFVSMVLNKNISCVTLFMFLIENEVFRNSVLKIGSCSWYDLVQHMSYRYPILHKSKKIKKIV